MKKHKEARQALVAVLKTSPTAPLCAHMCCDRVMCIISSNTSKEKGSHSLPSADSVSLVDEDEAGL